MSGNRTLTRLSGIVSIVSLTVATENQYANAVLPEGILVKKSDGVIYRTDGTHAIRDLIPVADQVLTHSEKVALNNAFSTGSYVIAPGGVVLHGSNGKINDNSLNIVSSGKIKASYLSDFVSNGMIKYAVLPEDVKTSFIVVNTYRDLLNLSAEDRKKLIVVINSSDDPTNGSAGNSIYYYHNGSWQNVIMVANASVTYESVQAVSGVMYDHPLHLKTDASNIHALLDALVIGEVVPDEPDDPTPVDPDEPTPDEPDVPVEPVSNHDETPDYIGTGWVNFINGLNAALTAPVPDVYVEDNSYPGHVSIESNELNLAQTTYTIINTTTNDTIVLPVTSIVPNTTGVAVIEYDEDDPDIHELLYPSDGQSVVKNQILHLVVSDGTLTFTKDITRNNCFYDLYYPAEISIENGWSSDNTAGYLI